MKLRMFSVPYNGADANKYIAVISPYMVHIDSVFFGLPSLLDTHPRYRNTEEAYTAEVNTYNFLSKKIPCKRFLTLNKAHYHKSDKELQNFCIERAFPLIEEYGIEGIIVSDYNMAKFIHRHKPELEMSTSCNCFTYNIKAMQRWKNDCNITIFNPPRDILRMPSLLKEMHDEGFKLKCIVNESCIYGCTQQMMHCFSWTGIKPSGTYEYACQHIQGPDILKCNWILPRWMKYLDEYVDVYKIIGRGAKLDRIASMLDAYINERDDVYLDDFIYGGAYRGPHYNLPVNIIPDKLLTCNCRECKKSCNLCDEIIKKWQES